MEPRSKIVPDSNTHADTRLDPRNGAMPSEFIPVLRPHLPTADSIVKYLRLMDQSRVYSNFGPLVIEFQRRLEDVLCVPPNSIVSAASGTAGIMGAILATAGTATATVRPFALMPSFTFAATAIAAERCGFKPYLVDVDPETWCVDAAILENHLALDQIGVVIVVAPFGRPVRQSPWIEFEARTGIPVIIDAAASFACIARSSEGFLGPIPTVLSFHATKGFGIGEGGCVISTKSGLYERVVPALNFGFVIKRDSAVPSLNGRMSEYHAAVGLAALDEWPKSCQSFETVARNYRNAFTSIGLGGRFFCYPTVDGNYALYLCETSSQATRVQARLCESQIDFRFWYDRGLHHHRHFSGATRDSLPVTEMLGRQLIGLPMAPDLDERAIRRIVAAVHASVADCIEGADVAMGRCTADREHCAP